MWIEDEYAKGTIAFAVYDRLIKSDMRCITQVRLVAVGCTGQIKMLCCSPCATDGQSISQESGTCLSHNWSVIYASRSSIRKPKKLSRKMEVLTSPSQYVDLISEHVTATKLGDIETLNWKNAVQDVIKPTVQLRFKTSQCKGIFIQRSKELGNFVVMWEILYAFDIGTPKSICKKSKVAEMKYL